jgi:hypothetical protein
MTCTNHEVHTYMALHRVDNSALTTFRLSPIGYGAPSMFLLLMFVRLIIASKSLLVLLMLLA